MSSDAIAISARGLSKSYVIQRRHQESTLVEAMLNRVRAPFSKEHKEIVWSLKDASFDIKQGEIVGLIGKNGAGKSTLLKLLSRITEPTEGHATFRGRIGSLIEVGTGFQPELSGRENIFLNGAILGMTRKEINRRFDEIVAFSGVEQYLDTPVKRYSSGMYVRLAFAVAAHLDTEILLVDEVLAVGDADFQAKSIQKMSEVARSGRTIVFVSHNTATIETLCSSALLLQSGKLINQGPVNEIISQYHNLALAGGDQSDSRVDYADSFSYFKSADLLDADGAPSRIYPVGSSLVVDVEMEAAETLTSPILTLFVDSVIGQNFLTLRSPCNQFALPPLKGRCRVTCRVDNLPIMPGEYKVGIALGSEGMRLEKIKKGLQFTVVNADVFNDGWGASNMGVCIAKSDWSIDYA